MGRSKSHRKAKANNRPLPIENPQKLADRLYKQGIITRVQAKGPRIPIKYTESRR